MHHQPFIGPHICLSVFLVILGVRDDRRGYSGGLGEGRAASHHAGPQLSFLWTPHYHGPLH